MVDSLKFKTGQWVRLKRDGELYRVSDKDSSTSRWALGGHVFGTLALDGEIELALPQKGEWWCYKPCETHHHGWDRRRMSPFVVDDVEEKWMKDCGYANDYIACGCLEPVGYGRGE